MPHGECNALLLDHVIAFNYAQVPERYARIAEALGVPVATMDSGAIKKELLRRIQQLKLEVGIESGLGRRGAKTSDIPELARNAMNDPCMVTNPRDAEVRDIEVIYEEAL